PLVAILIVGNGVMIGLQTEPGFDEWPGWTYVELVFAAFLLLEIALRMHLLRCRNYWCGTERWWNWFDLFLAATGILDISVQMVGEEDSAFAGASLLRFCRLIRLVRIVKVFRIKFMKDLRLMVKGLIAGIRTLTLAFLLLFAVLYVISGFATMTIGSDTRTKELELEEYFYNIPAAMFTAFRCFNGECVNRRGEPINFLLADAFGLPFILFYVVSYMLVTMGIFNVILAVYVDITMKAAKENDAVTAEQHARESIRVARTTRELLKKFAGAYHVFNEEDGKNKLDKLPSHMLFTEEGLQDKVEITKELFLLVIQDRGVQKLMDDLDLPPDRANLFEIIDADGSGTLQITELLQGLLKIRGEINKSDTVASLLATKALQSMIGELKDESLRHFEDFHNELQQQFAEFAQHMTTSISNVKFRSTRNRPKDLNTLAAPLRPDDLPPEIEMEPP
ncbi:Cacna1c, partial [Symbiodinium necroappetens]